ncbi:hypothetical protein GPY51_21890 [Photorhabdus laumondii subsp. laumondii]|uniref:Uncharacterized protein n=1 Tax=Photorhabdus laumondii subsp. laumondii TaxID=141679 RepID=A0A6L9JPX0_PHOLM|nr:MULTISPECIES: hypothetical protein [Photorhabdus]AWK43655.1 hypothetical protein A4R40_20230 [Photorhabdus laumondii subsp. laumondii]AXG44337.1 hypothetical protein PluDJC_20175 [Photorhabdus laumondii subsp. laumondii]AXG48966.1 hypothetical protein PluTT01m_20870 [Photorhabdus laumondii subsp. laumondii]KTL59886.1 hypothetical protein AA106_15315 [Photorhabdus laumondii subsp. laumondii]MCC8389528.1 hypothetical protein [Photorhabdus laumondii]
MIKDFLKQVKKLGTILILEEKTSGKMAFKSINRIKKIFSNKRFCMTERRFPKMKIIVKKS